MDTDTTSPPQNHRAGFGIAGLDAVLGGGVPRQTLFLVQGAPGAGKTTLGMQFLLDGIRRGEPVLLVSNAETPRELGRIAATHGWDIDALEVMRLQDDATVHDGADGPGSSEYTLFPAAEVEVGETLAHLFETIDRIGPRRLVFDSISGLRVLAREPAFYRRQLQRLRDFLADRACTTVLIDDVAAGDLDLRTQTLCHGLLELDSVVFKYGGERRRLRVRKLRGSEYTSGYHDFVIERGGGVVYPRLVAVTHESVAVGAPAESGIATLDALAGGGLPRASTTLLLGPSGCGKSTLASVYAHAAAERGEKVALYLFDESAESWCARARGLGMELAEHIDAGRLVATHVDPAELTLGQIAHRIVEQVSDEGASIVIIDTVNGYLHGALDQAHVVLHLRELSSYLARRGAMTLLTHTQHGILGADMRSELDLSFLSDNVMLLRFFEAEGGIRKAISMVKRRIGGHERTIRELRIGPERVALSEPLADFVGVLSGAPTFRGAGHDLGSGP